jgi:hypothetical protein
MSVGRSKKQRQEDSRTQQHAADAPVRGSLGPNATGRNRVRHAILLSPSNDGLCRARFQPPALVVASAGSNVAPTALPTEDFASIRKEPDPKNSQGAWLQSPGFAARSSNAWTAATPSRHDPPPLCSMATTYCSARQPKAGLAHGLVIGTVASRRSCWR